MYDTMASSMLIFEILHFAMHSFLFVFALEIASVSLFSVLLIRLFVPIERSIA